MNNFCMAKKKGKVAPEEMYSMYNEYIEEEERNEEEHMQVSTEESMSVAEVEEKHKKDSSVAQKEVASRLERLSMARVVQKPKVIIKKEEKAKDSGYRSPICCILGHADTGKTKILDRIRETEVQLGEAGGITQQIGATYIPVESLGKRYGITAMHIPGLLVIDTPGHEAFSNLRSRGSSMCNIVVLVIDIMHGIELQTKESINILRARKTPFVISLNKIDRIEGWVSKETPFSIKTQKKSAQQEFKDRYEKIVLDLSMEGLNTTIFLKNKDPKSYVSIVPTSAVTGEGICDLLGLIISLVETKMLKKVRYEEAVECMVLEARSEEGQAPSIDVILSSGTLSEGDRMVLCTKTGAIDTTIRKLLTPHPMRETRVKCRYEENKQVRAAIGVRIIAPKLEGVLAGSKVYIVTEEEIEKKKKEVEEQIRHTIKSLVTGKATNEDNLFDSVGEDGVHAQASTLGALEALIYILKESKIPVRTVGVGSISKKDIMKVSTISERRPELAVMLCFDLKPSPEMQQQAQAHKVEILSADIIYHLTEKYKSHIERFLARKEEELKEKIIFPCILSIVPGCVFTKRSPLVLGVKVVEGILRMGTPMAVVHEGVVTPIGKIRSILEDTKVNPKTDKLKPGARASVKIELSSGETPIVFGKKIFEQDEIISRMTREAIDILKDNFKDALTQDDWRTVIKIKDLLGII